MPHTVCTSAHVAVSLAGRSRQSKLCLFLWQPPVLPWQPAYKHPATSVPNAATTCSLHKATPFSHTFPCTSCMLTVALSTLIRSIQLVLTCCNLHRWCHFTICILVKTLSLHAWRYCNLHCMSCFKATNTRVPDRVFLQKL